VETELGGLALVATVLSPVAAVGVFVGTVVYDRRRRRQEALARALASARGMVLRTAKWRGWPFPISHLTFWPIDLLRSIADLVAVIPPKKYGRLSLWLVAGASQLGQEVQSARRKEATRHLLYVLSAPELDGKRGLDIALEYADAHPWPAEPSRPPLAWQILGDASSVVVRSLSGDPTFARREDR
jgi:hypothetical protein